MINRLKARTKFKYGFVAQLVEQLTLNQLVEGSSPSGPKLKKPQAGLF